MHELSEQQRRKLLENPNVEKITEKFIQYSSSFKIKAVERYLRGDHPDQIFTDAKILINFFEKQYARHCLKRWKKKYEEEGAESLTNDRRGTGSLGRPKNENLDELTYEELQAIIEIQRGVIEELKKQKALAKKKR